MRVKGRTCAEIPFPVAPKKEQFRVIAEIEQQFTRLEAGVAALKRLQANLKRYRASVLKAAVEGRLVPTEAELARRDGRAFESAAALIRRITNVFDVEHQADDLIDLPDGWAWTLLARLVEGGPQNGLYLPKSKYGSGTPILRIDDFQSSYSRPSNELRLVEASDEEKSTYSLSAGDLVINRVNSPSHLGKSLFVEERNLPSLFESNMMRIRLHSLVSARFVVFYLSSREGRSRLIIRAKWAVNQASINQQDVLLTPVPLAPFREQQRIVAELDKRICMIDKLEAQVEANLRRADRLRQAILKRAFEGKLAPQDPTDEPASMLLEHIRAEREVRTQARGPAKKNRPYKSAGAVAATED